MPKTKIQQRVAKGAAFLDEKIPGWAHHINPQRLVMESNSWCVLGQLAQVNQRFDAFDFGDNVLKLKQTERQYQYETLGFEYDDDQDAQVEAWTAEINKRLASSKKKVVKKKAPAKKVKVAKKKPVTQRRASKKARAKR